MPRLAGFTVAVLARAAACSQAGDTGRTSTTETSAPSTTTSTTVPEEGTTATTAVSMPQGPEILTVLTSLDPGVTYLHQGLGIPFTITPQLDAWAVEEIGDAFMQLKNVSTDAGPGVVATVMVFMSDEQPEELVDFYSDPLIASDTTTPRATTVGGLDGTTFDVLVPPDPDNTLRPRNLTGDSECALRAELFAERIDRLDGAFSVDLVGCAWNRIWLVDVKGITVTVTVGPDVRTKDQINVLTELGPYVDDFINAITFCTEAGQCDG